MPQIVNTNIMSLNAQRNLNKSQNISNQAMERLSSGLRINSAKDDAAGLAISTGMQSQIKGINQGIRNANDGISMTQTAEGSMDEMSNILQRMRELSVQSSNDTNSVSNRESIQKEVDQLHSELDRIAGTTEFNGTKLLDGSSGKTTLQIGANSGENLTFSIASVTTNDLGLNGNLKKGDLNGGRVTGAMTNSSMDINGVDIPSSDTGSATDIAKAINTKTAETGVTASAYNVVQGDDASTTVTGITTGITIKVGTADSVTLGPTSSMDNLVETINRDVAGVTASLGDKGELLLTNDDGADINISAAAQTDLDAAGFSGVPPAGQTFSGYIALDSADDSPIGVTGSGTTNAGFTVANGAGAIVSSGDASTGLTAGILATDHIEINGVEIAAVSASTQADFLAHINSYTEETGVTVSGTAATGYTFTAEDGKGVDISSGASTQDLRTAALTKLGMQAEMGGKSIDSMGTNVRTAAGASNSIDLIDKALSKISDSRADLGAVQNRLGSTISNLSNVSQNLSASNSRIQDADFAAESSKMSKAQILQQAGTSMLSQANASTQNVMSLLQG